MASILVVDDEKRFAKILSVVLTEEGHDVRQAGDGRQALELFDRLTPNVVISDLKMPGLSGEELLREIKGRSPNTPVIILTAFGTIESAVGAMRQGAFHYILKPVNLDELKITVNNALELQQLTLRNEYYFEQEKQRFENLIGRSEAMRQVFRMIDRVADSDSTVLITGESGTGKELAARAIHDRSGRNRKPFVPINCVAIPEELLESELFGHVKGAFTGAIQNRHGRFEMANQGTIFLDEIGDMSPRLQGKLLRVLQEKCIEPVGSSSTRRVDVRIVAATNADLEARVRQGAFREDLFYRLNVVPLRMPPLRERKEDIPPLVEHFLQKHGRGDDPKIALDTESLQVLSRYDWPGNIRELENVIERVVVLRSPEIIRQMGLVPLSGQREDEAPVNSGEILTSSDTAPGDEESSGLSDYPETYREAKKQLLDEFEEGFFRILLQKAEGNISEAARRAGMHRKNLYQKLDQLKIDPGEFEDTA